MMSNDKQELLRLIEKQQEIQMTNPPSSKKWQDASEEIKRLVTLLNGTTPKDAWGKK